MFCKTLLPRSASNLLATSLIVVTATAQTTSLTVPNTFETVEANSAVFWAVSPFDSHRQLVLDSRHFPGKAGQEIVAISMRRNTGLNESLRGGRLWISMRVSNSNASTARPADAFAANRGADDRLVFDRYLALPPTPASTTKPAPWRAPHIVTFPFTEPFRYLGRSIVIDTVTLLKKPEEPQRPDTTPFWTADGSITDPTGSVTAYGTSCIASMPGTPAGAEPASLSLGSSAEYFLYGGHRTGLAILAVGTKQLDLDLTATGAPGCRAYTDWLILLASPITEMPGQRHASANTRFPLPTTPTLAGMDLFAQWFVTATNRLGLTASNGIRATLGRPQDDGVAWIETSDTEAAKGRVILGRAPVLLFTFQKSE